VVLACSGSDRFALFRSVAVACALTLFIGTAHHAATLATEPHHQGVNLARWLTLRHGLSHLALDWSRTGIVRERHLSAFEVFERVCQPLLHDGGGESAALGVWMHAWVFACSIAQAWVFFTPVWACPWLQFAFAVFGLRAATMAVVGAAHSVHTRESARTAVLQRLHGLTRTGNWGGGGEIALNVPGSKVNQTAWCKLVEAVFARVELGSARGMSRRDVLGHVLLSVRVVAWSLVCGAAALLFGVDDRARNAAMASVPAAWAVAVGMWVWAVEHSAGRVDRLKEGVLRLHGGGAGEVGGGVGGARANTALQQFSRYRLSRDLALVVGAALAVLLVCSGGAGARVPEAEGSCAAHHRIHTSPSLPLST
jgi:hypothetical protein